MRLPFCSNVTYQVTIGDAMSTTATGQPITRRNTRQRQLVLDAVRSRCDHPTAEDIYLQVRETDERVSRGTVYRNLNLLTEAGVITTVRPRAPPLDWRCDGHGRGLPLLRCRRRRRCPAMTGSTSARARDGVFGRRAQPIRGTCPACQRAAQS
ncbi:MAG: transcriptional repressor [Collinsella aerofaciens]